MRIYSVFCSGWLENGKVFSLSYSVEALDAATAIREVMNIIGKGTVIIDLEVQCSRIKIPLR